MTGGLTGMESALHPGDGDAELGSERERLLQLSR